jgi:hypothetical protein
MKLLKLSTASTSYAVLVSKAIWSARYPEQVRGGDEVTDSYCAYIVHPNTNDVALLFPDEIIPVHPMRNIGPLLEVITAPLPEEMKTEVAAHLEFFDWDNVPTTIENLLPPLYAANLMTREQAEAAGWFNSGI